jgi:hypothetical protein
MFSRTLRFASISVSVGAFALFLIALLSSAPSASADASHIRIIRISYVQGDVRFARDVKGDPLAGAENITWENAELNLPIRQGFVISTEKGRAEVEFENGSLALIGENTVLQFFDLSLEDGSKTTRLILRQGTARLFQRHRRRLQRRSRWPLRVSPRQFRRRQPHQRHQGPCQRPAQKGLDHTGQGSDVLHEGRRSKKFRHRDEHLPRR